MKKTITRTFSVENEIFKEFEEICKSKKLNKSKIIQNCIKGFIVDNFEFEGKTFNLILDDVYEPVKVVKKEEYMIHLDDGNIINYFTFKKMYEELDPQVQVVKDWIDRSISKEDEELVDIVSEDFLNCTIDPTKVLEGLEKYDIDNDVEKMMEESSKVAKKLREKGYIQSNNMTKYTDEIINPDEFLKCNLPVEEVEEFVEKIDEDIDVSKNDNLPKLKFHYHMDDEEIEKTNKLLLDQDYKGNDILDATHLYGFDGLEIKIFDYNLIVLFDEKTSFNKLELIEILEKTIKRNNNIINIKLVSYSKWEYNKMCSHISKNLTLSFGNLKTIDDKTRVIMIEDFIKNKFNLKQFSITTLVNTYSKDNEDNEDRKVYMVTIHPMMLRNEEFIKILDKYLIAGKTIDVNGKETTPILKFNFEKYPSVQNLHFEYKRELKELKLNYSGDELQIKIDELDKKIDKKMHINEPTYDIFNLVNLVD